jgi:hypothetical protein
VAGLLALYPLGFYILGPSDEEEKVVKGLLEGCSLALRGYTQGKAPSYTFILLVLENILYAYRYVTSIEKNIRLAHFLAMYIWKGYCRK